MHNQHIWKETTADGEKREVRAIKFGGVWTIQAKLKDDEHWTYYKDEPLVDDLRELHDVLYRKYQRRRAAYEDVVLIEKMLEKRGEKTKAQLEAEADGE